MFYYPVLKYSNAEMGALEHLKEESMDRIIPIIESKMLSNENVDEWWTTFHTIGVYLNRKIGKSKFIYDFTTAYERIGEIMELKDPNGQNLIEHCMKKLEKENLNFIPCVHFDSPNWIINSVLQSNQQEIAIRIRCHDFNTPMEDLIVERITEKIINQATSKSIILLLDFYNHPVNESRIKSSIDNFSKLENSKLVLVLSNCPEDADGAPAMSFSSVRNREDLKIYKKMREQSPKLEFGDYTTRLKPEFENRNINYYNTYLKVFYTTEDEYYIGKSALLNQGIESFVDICQEIVDSDVYKGKDFSYGDAAIQDCADGRLTISNHSKPIEIGINHHIELTARQLYVASPIFT